MQDFFILTPLVCCDSDLMVRLGGAFRSLYRTPRGERQGSDGALSPLFRLVWLGKLAFGKGAAALAVRYYLDTIILI